MPKNPFYKNLLLWLTVTLAMVMLYNTFNKGVPQATKINYTEFWGMLNDDRINMATVVEQGNGVKELHVVDFENNRFTLLAPYDPDLIPMLREHGVVIAAQLPAENPWYMSVLVSWFPMIVLIGVWLFFI